MNVFELAEQYRQIEALLDGGADIEQVQDAINALEDAVDTKLQNIGFLIRNRKALIEAKKDAAKAMKEQCEQLDKDIERLSALALFLLKSTNRKKVETPYFNVSWQPNPGSCAVKDESKIPPEYFTEIPEQIVPAHRELDKAKLLADLRVGLVIEGAELQKSDRLVIK